MYIYILLLYLEYFQCLAISLFEHTLNLKIGECSGGYTVAVGAVYAGGEGRVHACCARVHNIERRQGVRDVLAEEGVQLAMEFAAEAARVAGYVQLPLCWCEVHASIAAPGCGDRDEYIVAGLVRRRGKAVEAGHGRCAGTGLHGLDGVNEEWVANVVFAAQLVRDEVDGGDGAVGFALVLDLAHGVQCLEIRHEESGCHERPASGRVHGGGVRKEMEGHEGVEAGNREGRGASGGDRFHDNGADQMGPGAE